MVFPDLSDLAPLTVAPASPSSTTSVSDGEDDYDDQVYSGVPSFTIPGQHHGAPSWKGGQAEWKGKGREIRRRGRGGVYELDEDEDMDERPGVGGDKLPYEIWMNILKLLSSVNDLKSCILVSHAWCQIGVEILWHKPVFGRVNTLYRLLNVIDPLPVADETIGGHRARMLIEGQQLRSMTSSPSGASSMGESASSLVPASPRPTSGTQLSKQTSSHRTLPWDYPQFLVDDPAELASAVDPPHRTFTYASFVRRLNLGSICDAMSDHSFFRLRTCVRLERLTLQGCLKLSDSVLASVLGDGNMPELVALDLTNVKLVTDRTVLALARGCPRLQGLNLSGCRLVTDEGVVAIAEGCRLLRRIKLVKCDLVTDVSIVALARSCPLLLEVDLVDVPQITSVASRELWLYSSHLRELRLSSCALLTDEGFPFLFPTASQSHPVTSLAPPVLSRPNSSSLLHPTSSNNSSSASTPYHTPLHSNAPSPEPTHALTLPPPPNWMRQFEHLRILDLTSCHQITDQAVDAIISNAPRIRSLVLAKCTGLTDDSLASISRLGRSLHQLHMGHVAKITDGAVARLARTCTRLRYIDLACCPLLTDMSVFELAQLPKLRRIGLVRVTNLTDNAIHALVERPSSLERIHLSYCENISIDAISYLLQRLGKLTHLSLTGVPAFRRPDLQKFCRQPPKDFNPHQRLAFCVYSGSGVHDLRRFLATSTQDRAPPSSPSSSVSISFEGDEPAPPPPAPPAPPAPVEAPTRYFVGGVNRQTSPAPGPPAFNPVVGSSRPRAAGVVGGAGAGAGGGGAGGGGGIWGPPGGGAGGAEQGGGSRWGAPGGGRGRN